jgi:guanine deaminase
MPTPVHTDPVTLRGWLLLPDDVADMPPRVRLTYGSIRLDSGVIASIEEDDAATDDAGDSISHAFAIARAHDPVILPGFVDAHLHLPQFDSIGVAGLELLDWLEQVIFPAEAKWEDPEYARAMARRVGATLASVGTTAFAAFGTVHAASTQAAIDELGTLGFTGLVGHVLMDRNGPEALLRHGSDLAAAARLTSVNGVAPSLAPRFAVACTTGLMRAAADLARERTWWLQTHLAETPRECDLVQQLESKAYVNVYQDCGVLGPRTILAHAIHLDDRDRSALAATRSVVAHCPTANRFLDAGVMGRASLADAGVRIVLGSDVAGGPDRSMVRVARAMLESAQQRGDAVPSAHHAWAKITHGAARTLGFADTGVLEPGRRADVLVVKPDLHGWLESPNPLSTLLYAWDDRWLTRTYLAGRVAYSNA